MKLSEFIKQFHYTNNGIGRNTPIDNIDKKQLLVGIAVEMEHTDNLNVSASIAIDHLTENENYYLILLESGLVDEKKAIQLGQKLLNVDVGDSQTNASQDAEKQEDDELADELLGYKPHNVNDYANEEFDYATQERNYWDKDKYNRYLELSKKDFNTLPENEKDEFFELWKEFKGIENKMDFQGFNEPQDPEIGHDEYLKKSGQMKSFDIKEGGNDFSVGNKVKISDGSGVDSNKTGVIVSPREIKTDGSGVPVNVQGAYKPVDWNREVAVRLDDGNLITMFKNRVHALNELSEDVNKHVVVYDGTSAYVTSEDDVADDVEIKGKFDNIDDADALVDKINGEAGNLYENVELARQVLKNRRLNEGMTKTDAVQLLIRHNIK